MKKYIISIILIAFLCTTKTLAQQVNTLYFFDNVPYASYINPALQTERDVYVGLPVLGWGQVSIGNLPFSVKDVLYKKNGQLVTFLHPEFGNKDKFYKKLKHHTSLGADYQVNILSFGWRKKNNYYSVGITERIDGGVSLPKDLFQLLLYGTAESYDVGREFNLKSLGATASAYTEIGVGVSTKLNEKLNIGYRIKLLLGTANLSFSPKKMKLSTSTDKWEITGDASFKMSSMLKINNDFSSIEMPSSIIDYIKPSGYGAAFDLGVTYDIIKDLKFSASITDLGFIYWNRNVKNIDAEMNFAFDGITVDGTSLFDDFSIGSAGDSLLGGLTNSLAINGEQEKNHYVSMPTAKLNIGLEYRFCKQKLGIGLLSRTMLYNKNIYEEITASFNMRPTNWFNFNVSYSMVNGRGSLGTALSLRGGPFLFFLAADYIPVTWTSYTAGADAQNQTKIPIPYDYTGFNLAGGITLVFGGRDSDKDGVKNKFDLCPKTPKGVKVDSVGCPLDTDGDGVPDYLDLCPDTPKEAYGKIDSLGCPLDTDGDGVPDYLDLCPETPKAAYGRIDSLGCPLDTDGDGVPDYIDQCPETPEAAYGKIDSLGCPIDTDKDGVFDYLDQCPNTPENVEVDSIGCPLDTDGDGVPDYLDKCPDTPKEAYGFINAEGCPIDTDEDTVLDYLDKCPDVKGVVENNGCPEINEKVLELFTKALQGIQFDSGKSTIRKSSNGILNEIVKVMEENPDYLLSIEGHTDNVGDPLKNLTLSDDRANAVRLFLIRAGIAGERITASGYGDTKPVADNATAAGRKENRRVELSVTFERLVTEKKGTE